ncbi:ABC transporter ATP-binding protein [Halapricum salinum]|uniref:ABC transporter ATP-binding protein n=1 Tax=Halapricum salinum TaxID=1457250 RepID=A0A4D6H8T0_9EURY|nr:ABC transporter ATP-binding protein [Halapricum salinum]QCC50303.1 ABC transporter ATP-binding protein [Halapricum salinum]
MAAIDVSGVTKQFGGVTALQNLDLTVEDGEVFGFLGPNGAGKSTTIDILLDHVRPTAGSARVFGMDAQDQSVSIRERTGVLPEGYGPLGQMTGRTHVEFALEAKGAGGDPDALLERVGITGAADRRAVDYSKGMKQRLMLAMALAGDPELLILDEPTTGLDPNGARTMRKIVQEEADRGATVFFSSHILEQVEAVCDRVGILNQGHLAAVDTIDGLREAAGATGQVRVTMDAVPDGLIETIEGLDGVNSVSITDGTLVAGCENPAKGAVVHRCYEAGTVEDVETSEASLEDLFVSYTGGGA